MAQLNLENEEQKTLSEVLKAVISDLSMEISHTDQQDYRDVLKKKKQTLSGIVEKLGGG
jgi:hypothetical protein